MYDIKEMDWILERSPADILGRLCICWATMVLWVRGASNARCVPAGVCPLEHYDQGLAGMLAHCLCVWVAGVRGLHACVCVCV